MTTTITMANAASKVKRTLRRQLGEGFSCDPLESYVRIVTPVLLPDGHNVQLYWRAAPPGAVLSDLGDAYEWLCINCVNLDARLTAAQEAAYHKAAAAYGVAYRDGALCVAVADDRQLADAVRRLAQAVAKVCQEAGGFPDAIAFK